MKTLGAWIAGIFALGLALGSFGSGSATPAEPAASELETALESAPPLHHVDCGEGREPLLEPFDVDGTTSFKIHGDRSVQRWRARPHARAAPHRNDE